MGLGLDAFYVCLRTLFPIIFEWIAMVDKADGKHKVILESASFAGVVLVGKGT